VKPGPKPHPKVTHIRHGNASKFNESQLLSDFRPDVELAQCPKHLQGAAREEYNRLGAELLRYGLVSKGDRGVLAMMATEWSRHVWAEQKIAAANAKDEDGEAGLVEETPQGYRMQSVYLQISRKSIELYHKLAAEFGLTPSARTRVTPGATPQLGLPGVEAPAGPKRPTLASFAT
jgi:P27 family predicted phage terminase small subunit